MTEEEQNALIESPVTDPAVAAVTELREASEPVLTPQKTRNYPGKINYDANHGCCAVEFSAAADMNKFFEDNNGCVVTSITALASGRFLVLYTIVLDDEELEIARERAEVVEQLISEKTAARRAAHQAAIEAANKAGDELERLAMLGKKCEHNHGAVIAENAKLKKAVKKAT